MVYVVERYLPGLSRAKLLSRLSRLEPVTEELCAGGIGVRYLGSTIVLDDEACFCQFEGSSQAAVAETNRRADLPFDRIVPAVLVQPTHRSSEMSVATPIPKTTTLRQSRPLAAIAAIAVVIALASWAIVSYVVNPGTRPVRSSAPTQVSVLRSLTPTAREYVRGILSLTPAQLRAAFGTILTSVPGRDGGRAAQPVRSSAATLASVLRSLTPSERRYVLGIMSLTALQFWAAFGTTPTPPVPRGGSSGSTSRSTTTTSTSVALPILPACGPGPCWRAATSASRPALHER